MAVAWTGWRAAGALVAFVVMPVLAAAAQDAGALALGAIIVVGVCVLVVAAAGLPFLLRRPWLVPLVAAAAFLTAFWGIGRFADSRYAHESIHCMTECSFTGFSTLALGMLVVPWSLLFAAAAHMRRVRAA